MNNLWPICIKDYEGIELDRGDAMIYHGRDLKHWRFNGVSQYQIFSLCVR